MTGSTAWLRKTDLGHFRRFPGSSRADSLAWVGRGGSTRQVIRFGSALRRLGVWTMGSRNRKAVHDNGADTDIRNQEVLRANRELAAYFKGKRTEREARAALKIIKAFIRDREKMDPSKRRPLPGAEPQRDSVSPKKAKKG